MNRLIEMELFVTIAQTGSFAAAARKLDISASYASKLTTRLEQRLGARLFQRTTRSVTLTAVGERFLEDCMRALELIDEAERAVAEKRNVAHGRLRVTVPTGLGHEWLSGALAQYLLANPQVRLDAVYTDRHVDLVAEGFDVAVRVGTLRDSSLVARRLTSVRISLVASPSFIAARRPITCIDALAQLPCLVHNVERATTVWTLECRGEQRDVAISGPMVTNSGRALVDAASHGLGIAFVPDFHCARRLAAGELVRVLPQWRGETPIQAVYPSARMVPINVRMFIDHLVEQMRRPAWLDLVPDA
jgi:DNA-binding transcriptional LysR family regulator